MDLKPGVQLASVVSDVTVVVVRCTSEVDLRCGGHPMVPVADRPLSAGGVESEWGDPTLIGKRYVDADGILEVLCCKAGEGTLSVGGVALTVKDAKPLPSSD